ncbi:MAG: hypothetical protein ACREJ3_14480 [Polyangiaceae bacterium]
MAAAPNDAGNQVGDASASMDAALAADATQSDGATPASDASGDATLAAGEAGAEAAAPEGPAQDDGSLPTYAGPDIFQTLCVTNPNVANFAFNTVQAPYTTVAGCQAYDSQGHPNVHNCLCAASACFPLLEQCDALPGCKAILKCELDSGCTDANSCFLYPGAPCATVITNYGVGSVATDLTQLLTACGTANMCPTK